MSENDRELSWYTVVTADVRKDKRLTPNAKFLYGDIAALSRQQGYCYASNAYFAELNDCTEQSIINWLNQLVKLGYIYREIIYDGPKRRHVKERRLYLREAAYSKLFEEGTQKKLKPSPKLFGEGTQKVLGDINTINNTINNTDIYTSDFSSFWDSYPRKDAKSEAREKYLARRKEGITQEQIMMAVENYKRHIADTNTAPNYVMQAKKFLGPHRLYEDYLEYHSPKEQDKLSGSKSKWRVEGDNYPF